ncbi:hypothetical protein ACFXKC_31130 [Streptomyces sp. NPDC059340]|uniref:hypothetical protein n=1 Tax=Streptomyces sp. NPDC059340 TaxID=3346806 RepID=UPI0036755890
MPNAKGVIIGEQQHFTQNNTDGVDPTLFATQLKDKLLGPGTTIAATMGAQMADQALAALVQ